MILYVARDKSKTEMITVKVSKIVYAEFQAACEMRGGSMSGILHQFMVKTVTEERTSQPGIFAQILARIYRRKFEEKGIAAYLEHPHPHEAGSSVQEIDHPEEIHNLEDLKTATRRKSSAQPKKKKNSA
jgi:hypothetical protein